MTAVRIAWEPPDLTACKFLKGYQVYLSKIKENSSVVLFLNKKIKYLDNNEYEFTNECGITISSLAVDTSYRIDVCVVTMKGKGPLASINVKTDSAGKFILIRET